MDGGTAGKPIRRRTSILLLLIVLLTIALRVAFVSGLEERLYWPDPEYYDKIAWRMATGEPVGPECRRGPVQSFLMAIPYSVFGHSYRAAYLFQAILAGLIPFLVFHIGRLLRDAAVGLLAAFFSAVYPFYIYVAGVFYATQIGIILLLLLVYLALRFRKEHSVRSILAQGAALGTLVLSLAISLVLLPAVFFWNLDRRRRPVWSAALVCLTALVVIAPWTVRNYAATGSLIPVRLGAGREFLYGNSPLATPTWHFDIPLDEEFNRRAKEVPPAVEDRMCWRRGIGYVLESPWRSAKLYVGKLVNLYRFSPETRTSNEFTSGRTRLLSILSYGPVFLLGLLGMWIERKRWRAYAPIYWSIAMLSLAYAAFHTAVRFRLPLDAYFMIFCAIAIVHALTKWSGRLRRFVESLG